MPLAIDLYCGLGGWTDGLLAAGYDVIGFDIERHEYDGERYPAQLVLQDATTLHGSQFKDASLIVASPPCQAYSYRAMPWKRAKALPPPDNTLFETCFRLQREASETAGRHIPMVVENVRGAQKWVGKAAWHYGSYYLWGDVPALMPFTNPRGVMKDGETNFHHSAKRALDGVKVPTMGARWYPPDHPKHVPGLAFNSHAERATKNTGGSWFNVGSPGQTVTNRNPVHDAVKHSAPGPRENGKGSAWFGSGPAAHGSRSNARKAASARIARIPFALASHIARVYLPAARPLAGDR